MIAQGKKSAKKQTHKEKRAQRKKSMKKEH